MSAVLQSATASGWPAALALHFANRRREGRDETFLARVEHSGPLAVQRAHTPEGGTPPHVHLLHPPGGIAGGDALAIDVHVARDAWALVTTPAATKVYRSDARAASQRVSLALDGGALEWLPQETIVFRGAEIDLATRVALRSGARFFGWEIVALGRPAADERFTAGRVRARFEVSVDGRPWWFDRVGFEGGARALDAAWGLHGHAAFGTCIAWPVAPACSTTPDPVLSVTRLGEGLVTRMRAARSVDILAAFERWRAHVRPAMFGRAALTPRIWAT